MTRTKRIATLVTAAAALLIVTAVPAGAEESTGRHFAEHIRMHASDGAFSGTHNPGVMHQGLSGWDAHHNR